MNAVYTELVHLEDVSVDFNFWVRGCAVMMYIWKSDLCALIYN